ncbi:MAG TPA: hypothetical protein VGQ99_06530 [Tepidisphaeraceae bacterium]|jgi:hypothetical protein|nr:hypothetical protein [Tepidisphaeraceae bacterium]
MEVDNWISGLPRGGGVIPWAAMAATAAIAASPVGRRIFSLAGRAADALAKNTAGAVLTVSVFALALTATISVLVDFPEPAVHDEFSYVLAGETFAHGRLTNPKHPLWEFFETIYVIHDPTYQSKYPPGQGLALAAGIAIVNEPIVGVWLSTALACGAVMRMLLAWLPRRWAVAGGFLAALHPVMIQWGETFWGGAVALTGGALVLGALRRLWDQPKFRDGLILGAGVLVLAISRPFEGLLLCIPVAVALLLWMIYRWRKGEATIVLRSVVLPCLLVLLPGALWMGYYNWRVTGHALLMPYIRHDQIYGRTPHFVWQHLRPPKLYNNPELAQQHDRWESEHWQRQQTFAGWGKEVGRKVFRLARGFFQPLPLLVALLMLLRALRRDRWLQLAAAFILFFIIGCWGITWNILLHYAAPIAPLALVLLVACLIEMAQRGGIWRIALQVVLGLFLLSLWPTCNFIKEVQTSGPQFTRARIVNTALQSFPSEKQLFVVRYLPGHNEHVEWVYNGADIDNQRIVWARDLGPQKLPKLLDYYKDRRKWLIEVGPLEVTPKPLGWQLPAGK